MTDPRPSVWPSAHGNHVLGYHGAVMIGLGPDDPQVRTVIECAHWHPTTKAARVCVGKAVAEIAALTLPAQQALSDTEKPG